MNNAGESHENGSVEKSHDLLKNALDQALRLRSNREFTSVAQSMKSSFGEYLTSATGPGPNVWRRSWRC